MKINQTVPIGTPATEPYTRCVSIDGDADRIVYFFTDENNQFYLLDGDRIATLYAGYVKTQFCSSKFYTKFQIFFNFHQFYLKIRFIFNHLL